MFVRAEAVGFSRRNSGLVVETLGGAGREKAEGSEPVEQLTSVLAKGEREGLERSKTRAHGQGGPAVEKPAGPDVGVVGPEVLEVLLEQASTHRAQVDAEQSAEPTALFGGEVVTALEQKPAGLGEQGGPAGGSQASDLLAADGVDGLAEKLHDVKAVQDVNGRRAARAYDAEEGLPHVAGDEHDGLGALWAEHVEEGVKACRGARLGDVEQTPVAVVELVDEGEVLVPLFPGQFVDADGGDAVEAAMLQAPLHSVLDAAEDGVPAGTKAACRLAPR